MEHREVTIHAEEQEKTAIWIRETVIAKCNQNIEEEEEEEEAATPTSGDHGR